MLHHFHYQDDLWVSSGSIVPSDGQAFDRFGASLALDGDTGMLVGAYLRDSSGVANSGAVYVFARSSGGSDWTETAILNPDDAAANDQFGCSIAVSGTIMVVGAQQESTRNGKVYVYSKANDVWVQQVGDTITASDGNAGDNFGSSVALDSGGTLVIGAPLRNSQLGSVYIFTLACGTTFRQTTVLEAPESTSGWDAFGASLAISGTTLLAGAVGAHDSTGSISSGKVYHFSYTGSEWQQIQTMADSGKILPPAIPRCCTQSLPHVTLCQMSASQCTLQSDLIAAPPSQHTMGCTCQWWQ